MDLSTITVSDFKSKFLRDFPYLRTWSATKSYSVEDETVKNDKIYKALQVSTNKDPETETSYWSEIEDYESSYVLDADIERSFLEAGMNFNQGLFGEDAQITLGFLYLSAHYLVMDLRAAQKGVNSSTENPINSRSVGSVSESYSIPEWVTKDKILNYYTKSSYGMKYLSFILGRMTGNVQAIQGATRA